MAYSDRAIRIPVLANVTESRLLKSRKYSLKLEKKALVEHRIHRNNHTNTQPDKYILSHINVFSWRTPSSTLYLISVHRILALFERIHRDKGY